MSDLLQSQSFLTWTKGPAALEVMKKTLCGHIRSVWIRFLHTLDPDEQEHLPQFIEDLNNDLVEADKKTKTWVFHCEHERCRTLLQKLTAIRYNQKSLNIVWNTNCKTIPKWEEFIGLAQIFDCPRANCETFYWHVANTFMLYGNERNDKESTGPEDTDVAMVLKMMKNCTLFEIDENELYEKVIVIRNSIFHTGQYNMTEGKMKSYIDMMIELLQQVLGLPDCKEKIKMKVSSGIEELTDIKGRNLISISLRSEWKEEALEALQLQKQAINCDMRFRGTVALDTTALKSILTSTEERIQEYTNSPEWKQRQTDMERKRLEEESRRKREEENIKQPLQRKIDDLQEQLRRSHSETDNLQDQLRRSQRETNNLQDQLRRGQGDNLAGQFSEGGANALSTLGPVGRAAGAVAGGAVGTVAEGGKKLLNMFF